MEVGVTPGAGPGAAETYLRLLAETELRRSLAYPRYQPPEPRGRWSPARAAAAVFSPPAARLSRAVWLVWSARPDRVLPVQVTQSAAGQAASTALGAVGQRAACAAGAARPAAESVLSRLAWAVGEVRWRSHRARWVITRRQPGRPWHHGQQAMIGVHHVDQAASALVTAEAISGATAHAVLAELTGALAARAKIGAEQAAGLGPGWSPGGAAPVLPAGPVRAVPVGLAVPLGPDGSLGSARVLTVVLAPDRATLTAVARLTSTDAIHGRPRPGTFSDPPAHDLSDHLTVTDSQGTHCQVTGSTGQASDDTWSMTFDLHPFPVPAARWLDVTIAPGAAPVRVDLPARGAGQPPRPGLARGGPGTGAPRLGAGRPADRPLDALAEHLLTHAARGGPPRPELLSALPGIAAALQAAGVLAPGSAALGRLAALADRLGVPFPASLRPLAGNAGLPAAWLSVLDRLGRADGPLQDAPVAAVLPEVDGARFALAGLRSAADSATVHALAWGWMPDHRAQDGERFSWWARDDAGRWQLAALDGHSYGAGQVDVDLRFMPPVHPSARSLDIFLVGPASQATVTVPLDWVATG